MRGGSLRNLILRKLKMANEKLRTINDFIESTGEGDIVLLHLEDGKGTYVGHRANVEDSGLVVMLPQLPYTPEMGRRQSSRLLKVETRQLYYGSGAFDLVKGYEVLKQKKSDS